MRIKRVAVFKEIMVRGKHSQYCGRDCEGLGMSIEAWCRMFTDKNGVIRLRAAAKPNRFYRCDQCLAAEVSEPEDY